MKTFKKQQYFNSILIWGSFTWTTVQVNNIYPASDLNKKQDKFACNRLNNYGNINIKTMLLLYSILDKS